MRLRRPKTDTVLDPITGESFPKNTSMGRLVCLEVAVRKDRVTNLILYAIAFAGVVLMVAGYFNIVELRAQRAADQLEQDHRQARTDQRICERQESAVEYIIDTNRLLSVNAEVLRDLIRASIAPRPDQPPRAPSQKLLVRRFKAEGRRLAANMETLRLARRALEAKLLELDCEHLPSNGLPPEP